MEIKRINLIPISVANFKYTPYKAQDKNLSSDSFPGHSSQIDKVNRIWYHIPYQILIAHTKVNSTLALIIFDISITSGLHYGGMESGQVPWQVRCKSNQIQQIANTQ